jgi:hypothetical protein
MRNISILIIFLFLVIACEKNTRNENRIYFEHYAINYAWAFSYVHWIIDDEGNVLTNRNNDSYIDINSIGLNNAKILFDSIIYKVNKQELEQYIALIEPATTGVLDSIPQYRRDFGGTVFNCFSYDNSNNIYTKILLSYMSDTMDIFNTDSSAIKIDNWLKSIHIKIFSN